MGTVTSNVGGISCGATCSASYTSGTSVILTAAGNGGTFTGWSGAGCSGTGTCTTSMTVAKTATATFTAVAPTLALTSAVSNITQTTATGSGTISSNGGATVTVSGVVWDLSTNPVPTTALATKTTDGWATGGPWSSPMTGLIANTTYRMRAYATNSAGTSYGNTVTFTTSAAALPNLTASAPPQITATVNVAQNFTSTITNSGNTSTGVGFTNLFQTSPSSTGASGVVDYSVAGMPILAGNGATDGTSKSITFTSTGTMYVRACADRSSAGDVNGVVNEGTNEGDNCSTPWTMVTVSAAAVMSGTLTPGPTTSCTITAG